MPQTHFTSLLRPGELEKLGIFAGVMGETASVFHIGFVVPKLDEAIATMRDVLGVPFVPPTTLPFSTVQSPKGPVSVPLRLAYSTRPVNVELIETSVPGTLWDFNDQHRGHHLGVWANDVAAEADRLASRGMPPLWWAKGEDGRMMFSFHLTPLGFYIELVDSVAKGFYPDWFSSADPELSATA